MKKILKIATIITIIMILSVIILNHFIKNNNKNYIHSINEITDNNYDCILILGAGVRGESPSPILEDRLLTGIELYKRNISNKIVVSGAHGQIHYDEVNVMKNYLINNNSLNLHLQYF